MVDIIRIYHELENGVEKSITKIPFWHHNTCRVMTTDDKKELILHHNTCRVMTTDDKKELILHHNTCRVMTTDDNKGLILHPILTLIIDSFSCSQ